MLDLQALSQRRKPASHMVYCPYGRAKPILAGSPLPLPITATSEQHQRITNGLSILLLGDCIPKGKQTHQDAFPASVCPDWKVSARQRLRVAADDVVASTVTTSRCPVGMLDRDHDDTSDGTLRYTF